MNNFVLDMKYGKGKKEERERERERENPILDDSKTYGTRRILGRKKIKLCLFKMHIEGSHTLLYAADEKVLSRRRRTKLFLLPCTVQLPYNKLELLFFSLTLRSKGCRKFDSK